MSGEFGDYRGPSQFFHHKIGDAIEDAQDGKWAPTIAMVPVLEALQAAAHSCSWAEAGDAYDVDEWLDNMVKLRDAVERAMLDPGVRVELGRK